MASACEEFRDRFSALWEKTLNPSEEAEVRKHIESCPGCREEFARFGKTLRMLHSVEEAEVPEGFLSGIYEKIGERKDKGLAPERIPGKGCARWKVPAQAVAMVAIVFLAVYLTRMMPGGSPRMKGAEESRPSTPAVKEEKPDRRQEPKELERAEKKETPAHVAEESGPVETRVKAKEKQEAIPPKIPEANQQTPRPAAAPAPHKPKLDAGLADKPTAEKTEVHGEGKGTGALQQRAVTASPGPAPSREFVVKTSDQEKSLAEIRQLINRLGGETLTAEGNVLLVSLPGSSLPEFRKELEEMEETSEARQAVSSKVARKGVSSERAVRGGVSQGKDQEMKALDAVKEAKVIVRIVLSGDTGESKDGE